jgi:hypothetical protein
MTLADLASRLGWLPCGTCSGGRVLGDCPSCNGVGWLPSPAVLEAMATALAQAICGDDICVSDEGCMADHREEARAAWEAEARLVLEGEK